MKLHWLTPFIMALGLFLPGLWLLTPVKAQVSVPSPTSGLELPLLQADSNLTSIMPISAPWLPGNAQNFDLVNYLGGGAAGQIAIQDHYAYTVLGVAELVILDVRNPASPIRVGAIARSLERVYELYLTDEYAYVMSRAGWWVVDISDPAHPLEVGLYPGWPFTAITFANGYAYLTNDQGLRIVELSSPAGPTEVAFFETATSIDQVVVSGSYAYLIGTNYQKLSVVNVAVPTAPRLVKSYKLRGGVTGLTASGDYLYWLDSLFQINILNVSNPLIVRKVGVFPASEGKLIVEADRIYFFHCLFCDDERRTLEVVDNSKPVQLTQQALITLPYKIKDAAVKGDYLYLATGETGLRILDVSQPTQPNEVGAYQANPKTIALAGDSAYLLTQQGIQIMDISDPAKIIPVGFYQTSSPGRSLAVVHHTAVLVDEANTVRLIDISNPAQPLEVGTYTPPEPLSQVTLAGDYAYLFDPAGSGLYIVDISNPRQPVETAFYPLQAITSVTVAGDNLHIAGLGGWYIVSIANPGNPVTLYSDTQARFSEVAVAGNYAYVAGENYYGKLLKIMDISDPAAPVSVEQDDNSSLNFFQHMVISGDYVYGSNYSHVQAMRLSPSATLIPLGFFNLGWDTESQLFSLAVTGTIVYLASPENGLAVLQFQPHPLPQPRLTLELTHHLGGAAEAIAIQDNYAYVGFGPELAVLDISNPAQPVRIGWLVLSPDQSATIQDITLVPPYAYLVDNNTLWVVDISKPTAPVEVSHMVIIPFDDPEVSLLNTTVKIAGDYAYLAQIIASKCSGSCSSISGKLTIIDVSAQQELRKVASLRIASPAMDLLISDHYAYIAAFDGHGLPVLDISNPLSPTRVADAGAATSFTNLVRVNGYIYATYNEEATFINPEVQLSEVTVITLTNPVSPTIAAILSRIDESYVTEDIVSVGHYLYVTEKLGYPPSQPRPEGDGLRILDITDPLSPTVAGFYPTPQGVTALAATAATVYLTNREGGVQILDASDPTKPVEVGHYNGFESACDVAAAGDALYLTDNNDLQVLTPTESTPLTTTRILENNRYSCNLSVITATEAAYLVDTNSLTPTLYSLDIADWLHPTLVHPAAAAYKLPGSNVMPALGLYPAGAKSDAIIRVLASDHFLYVNDDRYDSVMKSSLTSLDLSDPIHPVEVDKLFGFLGRPVVVQGDYAYLLLSIGGLGVLNISDSAQPQAVGWLNLGFFGTDYRWITDLAVQGNYAYLLARNGLHVVDISNPAQPVEVGYHEVPGSSQRLTVLGDSIYVAAERSGLFVFRAP